MREIYVGRTADGFHLSLPQKTRTEHVQIIGSTGRGKSKSVIEPWLIQDFCQGSSLILIDGKGDQKMAEKVLEFATRSADVIIFDLSDLVSSAVTNPLKYGSSLQVADRVFSTFEFENTYFETVSYEAVLLVLEVFKAKGREPKFRDLYQCLIDDQVYSALVTSPQESDKVDAVKMAIKYLSQPFRDRQEKLSGFLSQLRPFAMGELSHLVNGSDDSQRSFSLSEIVQTPARGRNKAVLILIPTLLYQKSAKRLGQMFLQEIAWASSARKTDEFLPIFLDEFSAFVYEGFLQLLNKARSSNIALHLSHQSMGDLEAVSLDFAKAIVTNTNVKCVLGLNDPETADFFARLFGTKSTQKKTERAEKKRFRDLEMSGQMSIRDVEEYRVHPNELKSFSKGKGVISFMNQGELIIEPVQFAMVPKGGGR